MAKSKGENQMAETEKATVAQCILAMSYGELLAMCNALTLLKHEDALRLETKEDFAALLSRWAEAQ